MEPQLPAPYGRRRSDRVSIAFALEVASVDHAGQRFSEKTKTTTVSRYGCALALQHMLETDQKLHLRRLDTDEITIGRVVAPMGAHADGHLYGIETRESCDSFWGIHFSSSFYEKLLDNTHDGVYFVNRDRKITYWNESAARLTGYTSTEILGKRCFDNLLGHVDETGRPLCVDGCPLTNVMLDGRERTVDIFLRHKQGHRVPVTVQAVPLRNSAGQIVGAVEMFRTPEAERRLHNLSASLQQPTVRDPLTGLPTPRYLELRIEQALQELSSFGRRFGLLLFDIDRFPAVSGSYGHAVAESLLKAIAQTLVSGLGPMDIVGRWESESFLVLAPDLDANSVFELAERCRALIRQTSVDAESSRVSATASVGATVLAQSDSAASAIARASELMSQSRRSGGGLTTAG